MSFAFKLAAVAAAVAVLSCSRAATIAVDWDSAVGPVKPVNGVGQPPMYGGPREFKMMHYLKEAGIPYSRLHDVGGRFGGGVYVDIPNVFPDFDADENLESSYLFDYTDALMKSLVDNGVEPFYRLGVTIENAVPFGFKPRRIHPPKDYMKWARICEHVIRHYNEGWAGGFKMNVTYWEIWNEPEGVSTLWLAPFDEYIKFYEVTSRYLKEKFPHLKFGGFGAVGFYAAVDAQITPLASAPLKRQYYHNCAIKFIKTAQERKFPLDFFSFHSYSDPREADQQIHYADWLLNEHGFTRDRTERIFDEWCAWPGVSCLGTPTQAAAIAEMLIRLQKGPCASAMIYDARCGVGPYSPLFNPLTLKPHKAYYAFMAFNELRKLGTEVKSSCDHKTVHCAAAKGPGGRAVMISNFNMDEDVPVSLEDAESAEAWIVDADRTWEKCKFPAAVPRSSVLLVKWTGAK